MNHEQPITKITKCVAEVFGERLKTLQFGDGLGDSEHELVVIHASGIVGGRISFAFPLAMWRDGESTELIEHFRFALDRQDSKTRAKQ